MARGQAFSGEILVAFTLFMSSIILVLSLWTQQSSEVLQNENRIMLEQSGVTAAEKLVRTPGFPSDWGVENVSSIGLANTSRILLRDKVKAFVNLTSDSRNDLCSGSGTNYECHLYLMGLSGGNFYFNMTNLTGHTVSIDGDEIFSGRYPINSTEFMPIVRTALLDDEIVRINLIIWK